MARKKQSDEEKKRKKKECERRRRQNIKNNPDRYKMEQEKKHQRYERAKEKGELKLKKDLSRRELKAKRKSWKVNSKRYRDRKNFLQNLVDNSPPVSDLEEVEPAEANRFNSIDVSICSSDKSTPSRQKIEGRKSMKRNRSKTYRDLLKIQRENRSLRSKMEYYKKKFYREVKKKGGNVISPNTEVKKILNRTPNIPEIAKRKLLFGEVMKRSLSSKFANLKDDKTKQIFTKIVDCPDLKKYKLLKECKEFLPPARHRSNQKRSEMFKYERKSSNAFNNTRNMVYKYFLSDKNSRLCPGKNDTITRRGIKKQKRYLNNSMKNLFNDFKKENAATQVSYAAFCKIRPFWVVHPKVSSRDTCLCILHENINLIVLSLSRSKIIKEKNVDQVVSQLCCSTSNETCLTRKCKTCIGNKVLYYVADDLWTHSLHYDKWITRREQRISAKTKKEITVQLTAKTKIEAKPDQLISQLENLLPKFLRHILNINHQYSSIKKLKNKLKENEILLHVDFSENYSCKYAKETQSVHFGAYREQITLHTLMMYHKTKKQGFCTFSKSLRHDPSAILAHLELPLNHYLNTICNEITTLHFLSDSPSTQYRNKKIFYFIEFVIPKLFPTVQQISWNYSEAGHGKGAPDGIGATVKRAEDRLVAFDQDINTFDIFMTAINKNVSNLFIDVVDEGHIEKMESNLQLMIKPFKGTMQAHQVTWRKGDAGLHFKELSCFECSFSNCSHFAITGTPAQTKQGTNAVVSRPTSNPALKENSWIAAIFDNDWYPGIIENIDEDDLAVNFMSKSGKSFFWPQTCDRQKLKLTGILSKLEFPPEPVSSRLFKFPNHDEIDDLFKALV